MVFTIRILECGPVREGLIASPFAIKGALAFWLWRGEKRNDDAEG